MNPKILLSRFSQWLFASVSLFIFVLFAMRFTAQAQTPTPSCIVTPTPAASPTATPVTCRQCPPTPPPYTPGPHPIVPIPSDYQPQDRADDILRWRVYTPEPTPSAALPGVVVIHGGGWRDGSPFQPGPEVVCVDLAAAGYYVVSVNYELAPCGLIPQQPCHQTDPSDNYDDGYWVQRQSHEIQAFVKALRADTTHCNGKIGVVGGSAGGTHAVNVALDTRSSSGWPWPSWTAADRPDCAVSLSGGYDFSDRTPSGYGSLDDFIIAVENYTRTGDPGLQKKYSSVSLVTTPTGQLPFKPLFLINSEFDDPPPYRQIVDMICALKAKAVPDNAYQTLTIPDTDAHAFDYWRRIQDDVITFLNQHLR